MKNSLVKASVLLCGIVAVSTGMNVACAQSEQPVFQISSQENPKVMRRELSAAPVEDNMTYMAFDPNGTMFYYDFRDKSTYGFLVKQAGDSKTRIDLLAPIKKLLPTSLVPNDTLDHAFGNLQIDKLGHIYLIYYAFDPFGAGKHHWKGRVPILIYSLDDGNTFTAAAIPGDPDQAFLEGRSPFTSSEWPPLIGWAKSTTEVVSKMANRNNYGVIVTRLDGNGLQLDRNLTITEQSPGVSVHTGGITFACTRGNESYVAYNQVPPDKKGNDIWVVKINRETGETTDRVKVTNLPKPDFQDIHITPLIVVSSNGQLNLITDGDGAPLQYFTAEGGHRRMEWQQAGQIPGSDIYTDLSIDGSNRLHLVYTDWSHAPRVYYTMYDPGTGSWSQPVTLLTVPQEFTSRTKDNYGIYYYKTCLDNQGNFYVSFSFWDTYESHLYPRKVMVRSAATGRWTVM